MVSGAAKARPSPGTAAANFAAELEHFRRQAEGAVQFLAAYLAVNNNVLRDHAIHSALNASALYWLTSQAALQQSAIITLGRIFDQKSRHNIDKLIGMAQGHNRAIFSKRALRERKRGNGPSEAESLEAHMVDVYEPTAQDFRAIRKLIGKWRSVYEVNYRPLRNSFLAHSEVIDPFEIDALHAPTSIGELQNLLDFLCSLHDALRDLLQDGRKPDLTSQRARGLTETVTKQAEATLHRLVKR